MCTQPSFQVVALAVPVGNLKPLVLIGYPSGQDRPILLPWDCPTNKARKFQTMSVMESQKVAERNQNKGSKNGCSLFIVLQTELASFPTSRNQRVILDFQQTQSYRKKMWSPLSMGALDKFLILLVSLWVVTNKLIILNVPIYCAIYFYNFLVYLVSL